MIKASAARAIGRLLTDLEAGPPVQRESAVARLSIIGARAVERLLVLLSSTKVPEARVGALHALEAIGDPRALDPAIQLTSDSDWNVALAAVGIVRAHLLSQDTSGAERALRCLVTLALDRSSDEPHRLAAVEALRDIPTSTIEPVLARLRVDGSAALQELIGASPHDQPFPDEPSLAEAARGALPDDPDALRTLIVTEAGRAPLTTLHRLVGVIHARERNVPIDSRHAWMTVRAAVHQALAVRGSLIALYDLREAIEAADRPLPVGFLAAASTIGDASCLEPLVTAYRRSQAFDDRLWSQHLVATFRDIVRRNRLTRRHAVLRRLTARWPEITEELLGRRA